MTRHTRIFLACLLSLVLSVSVSLAQNEPEYKEGELLVKFRQRIGSQAASLFHGRFGSKLKKRFRKAGIQLVKLRGGLTTKQAMKIYKEDPNVRYAEPNYILYAEDLFPDDPRFDDLWGLHNTAQSGGSADADIDAPEAWQTATGSDDVIVAVIDTGVDYNHEDLSANMWVNVKERDGTPGVDDDGNGYTDDIYGIDTANDDTDPMDDHGHGTHCSGTIGAVGGNGIGIVGVNWDARIMALKFLSGLGSGFTSDAIDCLEYAIMMKGKGHNIRITSNSWGGGGYSQSLHDAIQEAGDADILFIAAAGNDSENTDQSPHYPSSYDLPNIISVAATDHNDQLASFSNWGPTTVDVAAPGVNVLSCTPGNDYEYKSGTSMATPHVSGLAALILSRVPSSTRDQVKSNILSTADALASLQDLVSTEGRINAERALHFTGKGDISLDREIYGIGVDVNILVMDSNLNTDPMQVEQYNNIIIITTSGGDQEGNIAMTETGADTGVFAGAITTADTEVIPGNGTLQIVCGDSPQDTITATYHDADDGTGQPAIPSDTADTDCSPPAITNVEVTDIGYLTATITWETDEAADSLIYYGTTLAPELIESDASLVTSHSVTLTGLLLDTTYYFSVASADEAGNQTADDNDEQYYQFHSFVPTYYTVPDDFTTIQGAINAMVSGDVIIVRQGEYKENINFLGKAITVRSSSGPEDTIIDGNAYGSVMTFNSGEGTGSRLQGFTITNGSGSYVSRYGGGIYCIESSSPTISDCIISGNTCDWYGGGIYCRDSSSLTITNCIIRDNTAGKTGGGIYCQDSSPRITNCTISSNIATASAGGIYFKDDSNSTITNCVIIGNTAAGYKGGGILCGSSVSLTIINCTISGNSAGGGGGVYCSAYSRPTIVNSILWGDIPEEISVSPYGSSVIVSYSDIQGGLEGTGNIESDPLFLGGGDYHLSDSSPCIDTGDDSAPELPETDRDGQPRIMDGAVDMGAYEYPGAVGPVARFSAHPLSGAAPLKVFFTDESIGTIDSWAWDFGDGGISTEQSPSHAYNTAGVFTVALMVTSMGGDDTETKTNYIHVVNSAPVAQLESGAVEVDGDYMTVKLANSFVSPVVVCSVQYNNNAMPAVARVSNVTSESFDVRLQNPSGGAVAAERVSYLVVEEGVWTIDGVNIEAQTYLSTITDENNSWIGETQSYGQSYTNPVVLGQVMSENDTRWSVFWCQGRRRTKPPSATALKTGKTVCEDTDVTRVDETVGFIVFEAGHGTIGGVEFEALVGADTVKGVTNSPPYTYSFDTAFDLAPQVAVTTMAGMDGGNGGWAYMHGSTIATPANLYLSIDEDQIGDSERNHTSEQVGYVVFERPVVYPAAAGVRRRRGL